MLNLNNDMGMYVINDTIINDIYTLLYNVGEFDSEYEIEFNTECLNEGYNFSFTENKIADRFLECTINTPFFIDLDDDDTMWFINRYFDYIYEQFFIDARALALVNNINLADMFTVFALLHELGHMQQCIEDFSKYGKFHKNLAEYGNYKKSMQMLKNKNQYTKEKHFVAYRKISLELNADTRMINLFTKYRTAILNIVKNAQDKTEIFF